MNELTTVALDEGQLYSFLLASARNAAWLLVAPPFGRVIPARVRGGLAFALAIPMSITGEARALPESVLCLIAGVGVQAAVGMLVGFVVLAFISVFTVAGSLIDFSAGYTASTVFDPSVGQANSLMGRTYFLLASVLLFTTGGHLVVVEGYLRTYTVAPLSVPDFTSLGEFVVTNIGWLFLAALEMAFPVLATLLLVEVCLGLIARAAPQTNVLTLGFAAKTLVAVVVIGVSVRALPAAVESLVLAADGNIT